MITTPVRHYYQQQSTFTDPGAQVHLYHDLPTDAGELARVVQGLLIHPGLATLRLYQVQPAEIDSVRFGLRRVEDLLARIQQRHPGSLRHPRPPTQRIGAICRNFAVLLVSMLRQQGIPARYRVGFGGYFGSKRFYDHRIAEYWDHAQRRWMLVDPMIDDVQRQARDITFNTLDIRPGDPFLLAGEVWQRCRAGELEPDGFGDSDTDIAMPPIRYALLQDFAGLNKCEMLGNDEWGELLTKPEATLTHDDLALLDQIATLTLHVDNRFEELRACFEATAYGQTVREQMALHL